MNVLKKLVKGEYSLAVTFWGFGFLINTVIFFILLRFVLFITDDSPFLFFIMLAMLYVIKIFLSIMIFIGIYSLMKKNDDLFWDLNALVLQALDITGTLFGGVKLFSIFIL